MSRRPYLGMSVLLGSIASVLITALVTSQLGSEERERHEPVVLEAASPSTTTVQSRSPLFASAPGKHHGAPLAPSAPQEADPEGGSITGWVVTSRGEYLSGAQVGASSEEGSAFVSTDAQGRFEFSGLPSERMNVFATAVGYAADHAYRILVGTSDLMMVVDEPATIQGTMAAETLPHVFVRLCHQSEEFQKELCIKSEYSSPPATSYELTRLPSGEFDLVFVSDDRELRRQKVQIEPGKVLVVPQVTL